MKRFTYTLLMVFLIMIVAVGCGKDNGNGADNANKSKSDESVVLKVAYKDDGPSNETSVEYYEALSELLKEEKDLDVTFDLIEVAQGDYAEKLSLLLNSGEIPDIIYFQGGDRQIVNQDLLEDLTPYVEESEYIKDSLGGHNKTRLENYPYLLWIKNVDYKVPVVSKNLFETVNGEELLSNPSLDNYKEFLTKVKDESDADYAITAAGSIDELNSVFEMALGITESWLEEDGELVYKHVSEKEKARLSFYQELYEEGLLDKGFLTKKWDTKEDAFYNGESAVIVGTNGPVIDFYNNRMMQVNGDEAEIVVLPPASGESQGYGAMDVTKESRGLAISAISEHKDVAFQVLDFLGSPEGQVLDRFGLEGVHYQIDNDEITLTDEYYTEWESRYWEPADLDIPYDLNPDTPLLTEPGINSSELAREYFSEDNTFIIPEEMSTNWDAMNNLYLEFSADVITGKESIDNFDDFVSQWYKLGGEELTELAKENVK